MIDLLRVRDLPEEPTLKLLWTLLQERPYEANISHSGMPSWEDHKRFVRHSTHQGWYVIYAPTGTPSEYYDININFRGMYQPVGYVLLTSLNEIGVGILKAHHRKGYAKAAIQELMRLHPLPRYLANIAPNNAPSRALFEQVLGFRHYQNTFDFKPNQEV